MKYNYVKAAKIFDDFFNLCIDPWQITDDEKQTNRREFMHELTRGGDMSQYLEYIENEKRNVCIDDDGRNKYFDFDLMKSYDAIRDAIINFNNKEV